MTQAEADVETLRNMGIRVAVDGPAKYRHVMIYRDKSPILPAYYDSFDPLYARKFANAILAAVDEIEAV